MKRTTTATDYADRLERVVAHIGEHLDETLSLERLASVACFSPYHFHRIFRTAMGETTDQSVRRLRMHRAAVDLSQRSIPLARVASRAGYGSAEAFSRAFSAAYGCAPSEYRVETVAQTSAPGRSAVSETYEVSVEEVDGFALAGVPHHGDYQQIGAAFGRVYAWAGPRGLIGPNVRSIALYYSDKSSVPTDELRSFAGLAVDDDFEPAGDIEVVRIEGGPVARLLFQGPYSALDQPYEYLFGEWLPASGREPRDQPAYEEYLNNPRQTPPSELLTAICLPLQP